MYSSAVIYHNCFKIWLCPPADDWQCNNQLPICTQSHDQCHAEPWGVGLTHSAQKTRHPSSTNLCSPQVHPPLRPPPGEPPQHPEPGMKTHLKKQTNTIFTKWKLYFRHFILWFVFRVFAYEQQDPLSPSPYTALILHRLALDCNFEAQNLGFNCTTTQGQVRVETHTQDKTALHFCMIRGLFCSIFKFSCIVISVICNFFLSCLMTFKKK